MDCTQLNNISSFNNDIYNFLFHPFNSDDKWHNIASVITNIFLTVITFGLWQIPFWLFNTLDNRKIIIEDPKSGFKPETGILSGTLPASGPSSPLVEDLTILSLTSGTALPMPTSVSNSKEILEEAEKFKKLRQEAFFENYNGFLKKVKEEIGDNPSVIETYLKARDTLIIWKSLQGAREKLQCSKLEELQCSKLEEMIANAAGFGDWIKTVNNLKIKELDLAHKNLTYLPEELGGLENLSTLWLESNRFASFPSVIGKMKNLKQLHLQDNQITSIPNEIGNCPNLTYLALENNKLSSISPQIGNLEKLETLWLDNNKLSELPSTIGNCLNLRILSLDNNKISSLPKEITNLENLRKSWD